MNDMIKEKASRKRRVCGATCGATCRRVDVYGLVRSTILRSTLSARCRRKALLWSDGGCPSRKRLSVRACRIASVDALPLVCHDLQILLPLHDCMTLQSTETTVSETDERDVRRFCV